MTEAEWLAVTHLGNFAEVDSLNISDRKWSLLLSGCLPLLAHRDSCTKCREIVRTVLEYIADSGWEKGIEILREARRRAHPGGSSSFCTIFQCFHYLGHYWRGNMLWRECWLHLIDEINYLNYVHLDNLLSPQAGQDKEVVEKVLVSHRVATASEWAAGADLLREIAGNPFRSVAINAAWLAWNGGTVQQIAQAIYEERAFDRMPILADALEEAGCHDPDILSHCRQSGEHVRGCWVVDLLLGKE